MDKNFFSQLAAVKTLLRVFHRKSDILEWDLKELLEKDISSMEDHLFRGAAVNVARQLDVQLKTDAFAKSLSNHDLREPPG